MGSATKLKPRISVITPVYNRKDLIRHTLDSIVRQTYSNWELILIDDGSTDGSQSVIASYAEQDSRIRLFERKKEPKGAPTCRNIGIENSKGEYVLFLDSDDLLASFCLEQRISIIQQYPDVDFWVFPGLIFHEQVGDSSMLINSFDEDRDDLLRFFDQDTPWLIFNPIWSRDSLVRNLKWNESLPAFQDYDFHIQALLKGLSYQKFNVQPDCFWRRHDGETISRGKNAVNRIISLEKISSNLVEELRYQDRFLPEYKNSLASTYFNISSTLVSLGKRGQANSVWEKAHQLELISRSRFEEGKLYIRWLSQTWIKNASFGERIIKKFFYWYWGKKFFNKNYGGFTRTHFSGEIRY
jgi:glycosyltransferase involved in cell wall biosynthesis